MQTVLGILLIGCVYALVYYRLMVRHFFENATGRRESTIGALFSLPPYKVLPEHGRIYAKRYWIVVGILTACIVVLAYQINLAGGLTGLG
jgi:hypothetical protein